MKDKSKLIAVGSRARCGVRTDVSDEIILYEDEVSKKTHEDLFYFHDSSLDVA